MNLAMMMKKGRASVYVGAGILSLWYVWAWIRLVPPRAIRQTLYHGVNRIVPIAAHIQVTVVSPTQQTSPLFHWLFSWHHAVVVPPALKAYHLWAYTHLAYSDILSLYGAHQLFTHALPYLSTPIEYPVLMGVFMWVMAWVPTVVGYFLATGIVLWAAAMGTYLWLWRQNRRVALAFAMSPLFLVYGLLNWDIVGIFLMIIAVDRYDKGRYDAAAIWFAASVFFKFFPIFYLPFIAIDLYRRGQSKTLGRMVWIFVGTSAVINIPFMVGNLWNWAIFWVFNAGRGIGADIWSNRWIHLTSVPLIDAVSLGAVLAAMVVTGWRVGRGLSPYQAAALVFLMFLIVNKVYSPQYTLWMVGFACVAEWPVWSIVVLSVAGLIDYVNSFTVLKLVSQGTGAWYAGNVFPFGIAVRYLALAATLVGVVRTYAKIPRSPSGGSNFVAEQSVSS